MTTVMNGVLLSDDLIFSSKITATARAHGLSVGVAKSVERLLLLLGQASVRGVILDLHNDTLDMPQLLQQLQTRSEVPRVIAYGSHVDAERLRAARQAGCDRVMPRSQFVEVLESELPRWLA
jgi:DNA-binding NarL/FixJ family response regulator